MAGGSTGPYSSRALKAGTGGKLQGISYGPLSCFEGALDHGPLLLRWF